MSSYNGWKNWETWNAYNWINEFGLTTESVDFIEDWFADQADQIPAGFIKDAALHALSQIDWEEIAETLAEDDE